jgi:hypothetical protein
VGTCNVLQFPAKPPTVIERLDASACCVHRLQTASTRPSDEIRVAALAARLNLASLQDTMDDVFRSANAPSKNLTAVEYVWNGLENLLDQMVIFAVCSYEESRRPEDSYVVRIRLKAICQSTLVELHRLRTLLLSTSHIETKTLNVDLIQ